MKLAISPGLQFQKLTTKDPDDKQLEVALHALQKALELEDKKNSQIKDAGIIA